MGKERVEDGKGSRMGKEGFGRGEECGRVDREGEWKRFRRREVGGARERQEG